MAINYIHIDQSTTTATQAGVLKQFVQTLRQAYELGLRCREIMDHVNDGTNYAPLEALFGLSAGNGKIVYDMVVGATAAINGNAQNNDAKQLTERVG